MPQYSHRILPSSRWYESTERVPLVSSSRRVAETTRRLLETKGTRSVDSYHRELGKILWEYCGMARNATGLKVALSKIPELREQYWRDVKVLGTGEELRSEEHTSE